MDIFVKKDDKVEVEIYVWETDDGQPDATNDKSEIPEGKDAKIAKCVFRRPNYQDSNIIMKGYNMNSENADVMGFQDAVLKNLLLEISLDNKDFQMSGKVSSLHPSIARAAVVAVLEKISL